MAPGLLFRPIVGGEKPSNQVFGDGEVKSHGNLLSDARTTPGGIVLTDFGNGFNEFCAGSFGPGVTPARVGEPQSDLPVPQILVAA